MHLCRSLPTLLLLAPATAAQAVFVPQDVPTIQAALDLPGGRVIVVQPGTYSERLFVSEADETVIANAVTIDGSGVFPPPGIQGPAGVITVEGDGASLLLSGATITGAEQFQFDHTVVSLNGFTELLQCVVRDNEAVFGGFWGHGALRDCEFLDNLAGGEGGAIHGDPLVERCRIVGNRTVNGEGGGVFATAPMLITDSFILDNATGFDSYSGGGVSGPADIVRTVVAGNRIGGDPNPGYFGAGLYQVGHVIDSTIVDNQVVDFGCFACGSGGIFGALSVTGSIVYGNDDVQLTNVPSVSFSDVQGGAAGPGNFDADPLFVDPLAFDYGLGLGSPCIDAGDPAGELDIDGTVADLGALPVLGPLTDPSGGFAQSIGDGQATQFLVLDFGADAAGKGYLFAGTLSGTSPGLALGGLTIPLNPDAYTTLSLNAASAPPVVDGAGTLDFEGTGAAILQIATAQPAPLVGLTLHHAAVVLGSSGVEAVSNALPLTLLP